MMMDGGWESRSPPHSFMFLSDYIIANSFNHLSRQTVPTKRYHPFIPSSIITTSPSSNNIDDSHSLERQEGQPPAAFSPQQRRNDPLGDFHMHQPSWHLRRLQMAQELMLAPTHSEAHKLGTKALLFEPTTPRRWSLAGETRPQAHAVLMQGGPESTESRRTEETSATTTSFTTTTASSSVESSTRIRPYQSGNWMERYAELVDFKKKHGHCLVPNTFKENPPLAEWVKRQRYQYKLRNLGEHNSMTEERIQKLEQLGFVWNSHDQMWEERLNDLKLYLEINGDCNVPNKYPPDPSLAVWVKVSENSSDRAPIEWCRQPATPALEMVNERLQRVTN